VRFLAACYQLHIRAARLALRGRFADDCSLRPAARPMTPLSLVVQKAIHRDREITTCRRTSALVFFA
jgi:hypothetical protein